MKFRLILRYIYITYCYNFFRPKKKDVSLSFYYGDGVSLNDINIDLTNFKLHYDSNVWKLDSNFLSLKDKFRFDSVHYKIQIVDFINRYNTFYLNVSIKSWIDDEYKLLKRASSKKRILLTLDDRTFFVCSNKLYYSDLNMNSSVYCTEFCLDDLMYSEMLYEYGFYVIRTGSRIFISENLKEWSLIYNGERGIKDSIVLINENNLISLLFIEYTPGTIRKDNRLLKYTIHSKEFKTLLHFESKNCSSEYFARHIHVLAKDPYTGDLYLGTGDSDTESAIYYSKDNGESFFLLGKGSQNWRTLAFIFTEECVFWNIDSYEKQYLTRVFKYDISCECIREDLLVRYPLINSALWCTMSYKLENNEIMHIMSSNNEGGIYDKICRTYGIVIRANIPCVYNLLSVKPNTVYTQMFPLGIDNEKCVYLCDSDFLNIIKYQLVDLKKRDENC